MRREPVRVRSRKETAIVLVKDQGVRPPRKGPIQSEGSLRDLWDERGLIHHQAARGKKIRPEVPLSSKTPDQRLTFEEASRSTEEE